MGMLDWILPARLNKSDLARRIAAGSRASVWQRIAPRAGLLTSLPETRGYIQARAKSVVRGKLASVVPGPRRLSAADQRQILTLALAMVTEQFSGPMLHTQPAVTTLRRAA